MFMSSVHKVTLGSFLFGQKISLPDPDPLYPALKANSKAADVIMQSDYSRSCKLDHYILNARKLRG